MPFLYFYVQNLKKKVNFFDKILFRNEQNFGFMWSKKNFNFFIKLLVFWSKSNFFVKILRQIDQNFGYLGEH